MFHADNHIRIFERLRAEDPVYLQENHEFAGRFWNITKYEDIMFVDTNHDLFSSDGSIIVDDQDEDFPLPMFIAMDPPKHDQQRKEVSGVVAPRNLAALESTIRKRVQNILDSLPVGETINWVDLVSIELTTQMLATLFDFPFEDRRKLTRWSDVATADEDSGIVESEDQRRAELIECLEYFQRLLQERESSSDQGVDLVSMLANGESTKNMDPVEYLGNLILLIVGGNDTTRNSITGGVKFLNENPAEYDKLRANPNLIPNMVAEIIRYQTPLAYMRRTATQDVEIRGKQIKKGDKVLMWYVSGNRDSDVIEKADDFIIDRKQARNHLSLDSASTAVWAIDLPRCSYAFSGKRSWSASTRSRSSVKLKWFARPVKGYSELPVVLHPKK